jgi:hemerythrin-like metal-binding protein
MTQDNDTESLGISLLASDLREIHHLLFDLHHAMEAEETPAHIALLLHSLVEVTLYHFALEEGLMQATRYPHLEKHRAEHGWLMEQTRNLQEPLSDPTLDDTMLRILAIAHLKHRQQSDQLYTQWLNGMPLATRQVNNELL